MRAACPDAIFWERNKIMVEQDALPAPRMSALVAAQILVFIAAVVVAWLLLCGYVLHLHAGFAQLMGWVPLLVNNATMLFLTVLTAPALISTVKFPDVAVSVVFGTFFFAGAAYVAKAYAGARIKANPRPA